MIYGWVAHLCRRVAAVLHIVAEHFSEMDMVYSLLGSGHWPGSTPPLDQYLYFGLVYKHDSGKRAEVVVYARTDDLAKKEFEELGRAVFIYNFGRLRDGAHLSYIQENR